MKKYTALALSFILSFMTLLVPWEELRSVGFNDREVYLNYVNYGTNILEYTELTNLASYFSSEWLWHYILLNIDKIMTYEAFFYTISLLTLALMFLYLIINFGFFSFVFLLNPLVIDLVSSQYRISLALSLVLTSFFFRKYKLLSFALVLFSVFIHSSIAMFVIIFITINSLNRFYEHKYRIFILLLIFLGITVSWILSGQIYVILSFLGDRRADYDLDRISSSTSYLLFWLVNLLFVVCNSLKNRASSFDQKVSISILSLISANIFFGGYSTRIIAIFLPVIMKANLELRLYFKMPLFFIYFFYCAIQWNYWLI